MMHIRQMNWLHMCSQLPCPYKITFFYYRVPKLGTEYIPFVEGVKMISKANTRSPLYTD